MDAKARNEFVKTCRFLLEAEPNCTIGSVFGDSYCIKYPLEHYELLKPFVEGFKTTEYQVGNLSFSTNKRIFDCTVLEHGNSDGNAKAIYLCFRDEKSFLLAYEELVNCFNALIFGSNGISFNTIQKQIKEG
jgi:hypothetical protein